MQEEYPVKQMLIDIFALLAINFISFFLIIPSLAMSGTNHRLIVLAIYSGWMLIRLVSVVMKYKNEPDKIRLLIGLGAVISLLFYAIITAITLIPVSV